MAHLLREQTKELQGVGFILTKFANGVESSDGIQRLNRMQLNALRHTP